jgi:ribosomal protein S19
MVKVNSISKGTFKKVLILKLDNKLMGKNKIIFTKSDKILNNFIGHNFLIYKGCFYRNISVNKFLTNYRFGEFAYTRKPFRYMLKAKKK